MLRNTQELKGELDSVFAAAQLELTEELQELLRMAYERRRQLHLAALSAGRVHASPAYGMHDDGVVPLEHGNEAAMRPGGHARGEAGSAAVEAAAAAAAAAEVRSAMRKSLRFGGGAAVGDAGGGGGGGGGGGPPDPYGARGEARAGGALG